MATVKLIFWEAKANKAGEVPLYVRIIKDRKPKYISLGFRLLPKFWDAEKKKVRKSHPNSQRWNNYIAQKLAEAEGVALEMESADKYVKPKKIKEAIMGKASESFVGYFQEYVDGLLRQGKMGTHDKAKATLSKLNTFLDGKDLTFDQLNIGFLKRYETYLREELGNSANTIHSNLKIFRKLVNAAVDEEIVAFEKNPFLRYKLKWEKTTKEYLTEEELKKLEELKLKPGSKKDHHRNIYIFSAYTGGLRISDILKLKWINFDGEKINIKIQKTDDQLSIRVPNKGLEILQRYRGEGVEPGDFIFPLLKAGKEYDDPEVLFKAISSATAYANKGLKAMAEVMGLGHTMSFHTSRHTWATRALRKGMRIEYVSKLMGHASVKTTQIYAKIVNAELDRAMEVFND